MKKLLPLLLLVFAGHILFAQRDPRIANTGTPLSQVEQIVMPHLDNELLLAAEMERREPGIAPKFAENIEVNISPEKDGNWETLSNGNTVWRLRILSKGAKSLNLGFTKYFMPAGGSMILYSPDYQHVMGPFTPSDNEEHEQLWTPVLLGDELVIEVQLKAHTQPALQLKLSYVNHDFLGFASVASGNCNLDVICGEADGWGIVDKYRDIIQSVAVVGLNGSTFCTGFLVNNTRQDCTPYFMTAYHCGVNAGNAASFVAYWNYASNTCRQPGSPASGGNGGGSLNNFNTGAFFRAGWQSSDFTLLELDDPVNESANAFYAGWSRENFAPSDTVVCIHHPSTDEKRISFEFDPTYVGSWGGGNSPVPSGNHIVVADWDVGTTEGGSSGSPLFNNKGRVVGQLHGGQAACSNDKYDSYGWFYSSWEGGNSPATRLRDWLDPNNTGVLVLDGRAQKKCNYFVDGAPANLELCAPFDAIYTISVSENFEDSIGLTLTDLPAELTAVFETNPVPPGGSTILTISNTGALPQGSYTFSISGTDGAELGFSELTLYIASGLPNATSMVFPEDEEEGVGLKPVFVWDAIPFETYSIEVAEDGDFSTIIESAAGIEKGSYPLGAKLLPLKVYYWRLKAGNVCGESDWSPGKVFTTGLILCESGASLDVPKTISAFGAPTITSKFNSTVKGLVDAIKVVDLRISHSWVGDLSATLTSPSGAKITLMTNPQGGFCSGDNIEVFFDDDSSNPYSALNDMCNSTPPAIFGDFQPFEPLSAFIGEPAEGVWTLSVSDASNFNGGALNNWGLEICTAIPSEYSLYPLSEEIENCVNGESSFSMLIGAAFDPANGVALSAGNLPPGAVASFSSNPAQPGETVTVTLSGAESAGEFTIQLVANDGVDTGEEVIQWIVIGAPAAPVPDYPAQNATNISRSPNFKWAAVPGATYILQIATDPEMTDVFYTDVSTTTSLTAQVVLNYCTVYYWTISSDNGCEVSEPSEVHAFETLPDLSLTTSAASVTACNIGAASLTLTLGQCFEASGVTLLATGTPANLIVLFSDNPAQAGSQVMVALNLTGVTPGTYTIKIEGFDGVNQVSKNFNLVVNGPANATTMQTPANNATEVSLLPNFKWGAVSGANEYKLELALDDNFSEIVFETSTSQTAFTLTSPLLAKTKYFWRVTAFNDCGGTTPAAFSFTTQPYNSVGELQSFQFEIVPNPTNNFLNIRFSQPVIREVEATLYSITGVLLNRLRIEPGASSASFELADYPDGVYLLRMLVGNESLTERIILQK